MPNYQNSKIYKIVDLNEEMVYVGSTCQKYLSFRMAQHRQSYKREEYCSSHEIFNKYGMENCKILLLENYPCNNREELCKREGEFIKQLNCVNKRIAGRTEKEYRDNNKDKVRGYKKEYYQYNKDKIKDYREANKDKRREYMKDYFEVNKDKRREYQKKYYLKKKLSNI
jgi:hypothetical protein